MIHFQSVVKLHNTGRHLKENLGEASASDPVAYRTMLRIGLLKRSPVHSITEKQVEEERKESTLEQTQLLHRGKTSIPTTKSFPDMGWGRPFIPLSFNQSLAAPNPVISQLFSSQKRWSGLSHVLCLSGTRKDIGPFTGNSSYSFSNLISAHSGRISTLFPSAKPSYLWLALIFR